jgi:hypothetical protein
MTLTVDLTAARRLARRLEMKYPGLTNLDKVELVLQLQQDRPDLAEGLKIAWRLD